ncbi:hypothetical protein [Aurantiacibacter spongiae]|uniref:Uncharacterized protein n=1 Tax=Aurantiacibacter spongiae TaxID=2488860 RepID=A0A3N5CWR9_9SPHN|nr:hypothetical protein [Aurantiacibacter spongiae]RPF71099.1 hypothetical protein EG799_05335 [Aurantiacibacter spongiae]
MPDPDPTLWSAEVETLIMRCHPARDRTEDDVRSIVRQLLRLLARAPLTLRRRFGNTLGSAQVERLFDAHASELILLDLCSDVGVMMSRSPHKSVIASVSIADLDIECSFQSRDSLSVAMVSVIATAWLDVMDVTCLPD